MRELCISLDNINLDKNIRFIFREAPTRYVIRKLMMAITSQGQGSAFTLGYGGQAFLEPNLGDMYLDHCDRYMELLTSLHLVVEIGAWLNGELNPVMKEIILIAINDGYQMVFPDEKNLSDESKEIVFSLKCFAPSATPDDSGDEVEEKAHGRTPQW